MTVSVLLDFLIKQWVGLLCVIVVFPDNTHFFQQGSREESNLSSRLYWGFHENSGCLCSLINDCYLI